MLRELQAMGRLKHSLDDYEKRLAREIDIIRQMQFPGYFLIVWDFIRYAKEHDIPVGPGRGSAAGSLVAYALSITDIDPLQNELLFERFLNPERISMPDIDIDFCMNRRGKVIEYVTEKYGREQVAQIITFGTMADQGGDERFRPRDGYSVRRRRSHREDGAADAEHHHRPGAERLAGTSRGLRYRAADERADRHGEEARRAGAQLRRSRRRRCHLAASRLPTWCRCIAPRTTKSSPPTT